MFYPHFPLCLAAFALIKPSSANQVPLSGGAEDSKPHAAPGTGTWSEKYGSQYDLGFTGPLSFSHLEYARCLDNSSLTYDIAILGLPFDTAVSYRPGYVLVSNHC